MVEEGGGEDHGGLVQQILQTQQELQHGNKIAKAVEIVSWFWLKKKLLLHITESRTDGQSVRNIFFFHESYLPYKVFKYKLMLMDTNLCKGWRIDQRTGLSKFVNVPWILRVVGWNEQKPIISVCPSRFKMHYQNQIMFISWIAPWIHVALSAINLELRLMGRRAGFEEELYYFPLHPLIPPSLFILLSLPLSLPPSLPPYLSFPSPVHPLSISFGL